MGSGSLLGNGASSQFKKLEPHDQVRFHCMRCAECCQHVERTIILESLDAFRLAKHLSIKVPEVYAQYTELVYMPGSEFPLYALKSVGSAHACIFLKRKSCLVQEAKPKACQLYPFSIQPDVPDAKTFTCFQCMDRQHHWNGPIVRVKEWMDTYFTEEDREFRKEEWRWLNHIAPILFRLKQYGTDPKRLLEVLVFYRYLWFDTNLPFSIQHSRNNMALEIALTKMLDKNEKKRR